MEKTKTQQAIEEILDKGITFFDYKKQGKTLWNTYYSDAKLIVNSDVFQNEINHMVTDLTKECAVLDGTSLSNEKLIKLTNIQAMIIALETFRERMGSIENPNEQMESFDKYEGI